jgi:hypothetical protein
MVIVYAFACLLGTLMTFIVLSSHGWLVALLGAYVGGTALALTLAITVFVLRAREGFSDHNIADGLTIMVPSPHESR